MMSTSPPQMRGSGAVAHKAEIEKNLGSEDSEKTLPARGGDTA